MRNPCSSSLFSGAILLASCLATSATLCDTIPFRRGDSNVDGTVDLSDAIHSLGYLFLGSPADLDCHDASDSNGDGTIDLTDAVYGLAYLFQGGPPPPAPGPLECGSLAEAVLGCERYPACASPQPPVITDGPTATPGATVAGKAVTLSVAASDPDGDPLAYSWTQTEPAQPLGTFVSGQAAASAVWFPPAISEQVVFRLEVAVSDGIAPAVSDSVAVTATPPSYGSDVQPIWDSNCTSCHGVSFPSGDLSLVQGVSRANLVNVAALACPPLVRVQPGSPEGSALFRTISGNECGTRMPFSDPGFFDRNPGFLTTIRSWILAGAQDD